MNALTPNGPLPYLMDTPSTKDKIDKTIEPQYLFDNDICTPDQYQQIRNASLMAFGMISQYLREKGMVLVDTKTEHGINNKGNIVAADELYTMDSSRFWKLNDDGSFMSRDGKPVSFSKEFARGMVREKGQQFSTDQTNEIAVRYIDGLQHLTGKSFEPDLRPRDQRIIESVNLILDHLL
jgi:phosphoribosylaminoimidazole-succinocarboxamide synthase